MKELAIPQPISPILEVLLKTFAEGQVFVVGGAVRDWLLGRPMKDLDFVVRGVPINALTDFLNKHGETDLVGKRFGVIKFRPNGEKKYVDIALPRKEFSIGFGGGYRDFDVQSDPELPMEEDLSRRDFTINALAYDVKTKEIIDPFLGRKDLNTKIIRTVGSATTRFQQDYSRMLRAVRFSCQLNFSLSDQIVLTIQKLALHLTDTNETGMPVVAGEMISEEFLKAFHADSIKALTLLDELKIMEVILPELKALQSCKQSPPYHLEGTAYDHILLALKSIETEPYKAIFPDPLPMLSKVAILLHDIGKPQASSIKDGVIHFYGHEVNGAKMTNQICKRLKLGASPDFPFSGDDLTWLVREHLFAVKRQGQTIEATLLEETFFSPRRPGQNLLHLMLADELASVHDQTIKTSPFHELHQRLKKMAPHGTLPPPLLSGNDVIEYLHIEPSAKIGQILKEIREKQLNGTLNKKEEALGYLTKHYGSTNIHRQRSGRQKPSR